MPPNYPAGFAWGVATSAYQIEGGLNGPDQPRNNWAEAEASGRAARTGAGCGFWERWGGDLDRAASLGCDAFRLGIEWARVEPTASGGLDEAALDRYADILAGCRERGMEPAVTLQHFTHPEWLGTDPWLDPMVPRRFGAWAGEVVVALGERLAARGQAPVGLWITVNEPNALAMATYGFGVFPRGRRRGPRDVAPALAGLLEAHVWAYRAIHAAYALRGWQAPRVTLNTWACAAYGNDRMLVDLLRPATRGRLRELGPAFRAALPRSARDRALHGLVDRLVGREAVTRVARELGDDEDVLDVLALDYYGPWLGDYAAWPPRRHPWDWPARHERMALFLRAWAEPHGDREVLVLENGIGTRARPFEGGTHRRDGLTRDRALSDAMAGLDAAVAAGVRLGGYFHWSLIDNYEWGTFEPRFGLFGVDYERGGERMATDATGIDAAGIYRRAIAARR